ncbi:hypothetical protein CHH28_05415 [Bacterioplanes sanyensis]|uniref:DUF1318 domain-containing protein n=1 Tax=Bacterioplanes sanyensis TaxID=1249553 RepID=A0A222FGF3_9GAMM|nr:YdbL family protein [Bacterioplanes sanyensis]ASP38157.1 hypothetical protein CHH28_05415 [Bacterioplanes sanyensis]
MLRIVFTTLILLCAANLWALDLDQAKSQQLVGEQSDGYLGLLNPGHAEAAALVQRINHKRKQKYLEIADQQKTALANIEKIAGEKLTARAAKEQAPYQNANGQWVK